MKTLLPLLFLTISTQAQIIHWPTQRAHSDYPPPITRDNYAQVHRQYQWLPDGLTGNIRNNTDLLASLEVYPLTEFATPTGMVKIAGTRTFGLVDGVVTETWQTETQAEADARQAAAERAALLATGAPQAPILDDHPESAEIPDGGIFYRVPDGAGNLTLWYVRDQDHIATQLSAHDEAGRPIVRTFDCRTRRQQTIDVQGMTEARNFNELKAAKSERVVPVKEKPVKERVR